MHAVILAANRQRKRREETRVGEIEETFCDLCGEKCFNHTSRMPTHLLLGKLPRN